jgi:hypothetical protein
VALVVVEVLPAEAEVLPVVVVAADVVVPDSTISCVISQPALQMQGGLLFFPNRTLVVIRINLNSDHLCGWISLLRMMSSAAND